MTVDALAVKDRYKGAKKIEVSSSTNVAAGSSSTKEITATDGEVWLIRSVRVFVPAISTATQGDQEMGLSPTEISRFGGSGDVQFTVQSPYDSPVNLSNNAIQSGTLQRFDGNAYQANESLRGLAIDDTNGITGYYSNGTDAEQTDDRIYTVYAERFDS